MRTFEEYQALAAKVPVSLRNNRDRLELPVLGLQEEVGKLGPLLAKAFATGTFILTQEQTAEVKDRLGNVLWCVALLCGETGISMQDLAAHNLTELQKRKEGLDPDRR